MSSITIQLTKHPKQKPLDESKLGFGQIFTDHMFCMNYNIQEGWHDARVIPYENFSLSPATMVFHYGQAIFEGLKCYKTNQNTFNLFRPKDNFIRMNGSAKRMCIPEFDINTAMEGLFKLLEIDKDWVPTSRGTSLYIRPTIIATDPFLGVRASKTYLFFIILSPVGAYYANGLSPVSIYVEDEYVRAVRGGIGFTKAAANYAASLMASEAAHDKGFSQVLWLDGIEQKYIEEVGAMNMMFVYGENSNKTIVTPALNGSILAGITRDSVLQMGRKLGYNVIEKRMAISEVFDDIKSGRITEAFGTGTAAVISPVGSLSWKGESVTLGDGNIGSLSQKMYDSITGVQYGDLQDTMGWIITLP